MNTIYLFTNRRAELVWSGPSVNEAEYQFNLLKLTHGKYHKIVWELKPCDGCCKTTTHEALVKMKSVGSWVFKNMAQELLPIEPEVVAVETVEVVSLI